MTIKYKYHAKSISDISINIFSNIAKKSGLYDVRFLTNWQDIVGIELSLKCSPVTINRFKNHAVLVIRVSDRFLKANFTYFKQNMLDKIQLYFSTKLITDIKII